MTSSASRIMDNPDDLATSIDPVTVEIVRNAMKAVAERVTRRMIRASNSFIVKEMEDCSAALTDARGQIIAEESGPPIQLNTVGVCLRTILDGVIPIEEWHEGDVVLTNDPYIAGESLAATHSNDYLAFAPVFFEGEVVAFAGLMVHQLDIGAMNMGSRGWGVEIYQEGLRTPPMKLIERGRLDEKILSIIVTNSRVTETLQNDLLAQLSSVAGAVDEVAALFSKYGKLRMQACFNEIMAHSERRTRAEIEKIPDGTYRHEEPLLDDGSKGGPFYLRLAVTKSGSELVFDFTGTDKQIAGPINSPLSTTLAAIYYCVKALCDPTLAGNEGCKRPIKVIAPPGCLVNARPPAAVMQRSVVVHSIVDLIMGALAAALPSKTIADSSGCLYNYGICDDPRSGRRTMFGEVVPGGCGATAQADGMNAMIPHTASCHIPPIEAIELEQPVIYLRRELREGFAGAGRYRGGVGHVLSYRILGGNPQLHRTSQKSKSLPQGVHGGLPGDGGGWVINEGLPTEQWLENAIGDLVPLQEGDIVTQYTPTGGGYGPPSERPLALIERDVIYGFLTVDQAREIYGVEIDASKLSRPIAMIGAA